ncbi:MAG TPA: 3-hydroxyacyl-ACP dehydratase FabZ [Polyangia bacterium]|nr:3-hydroxyacyl-ACP dehydratase FabZ [Polyangia bacterium]
MSKVDVGPDEIQRILPHRAPFLFVDRVTDLEPERRVVAERALDPAEPHFAGHFPGRPIMPGVLITEALAQTAGLLLALSAMARGEDPGGRLFYLARAEMKWTAPVHPGESLSLEARLERTFGALTSFAVRAWTRRKDVARGTLTLALADADRAAP